MPVTIVGSNTPTAGGVVYGDGTSYASTTAGTSGQVLTSNGAAAPTWNAPAVVNLATGVTGTLPVANGGTNLTSYTTGDIVYASASGTLASLADVATGNALISGGVGVAPSYGKIGLATHVSGTLPVANGGTGSTTLTANNVLLGNGTSALQVVAPGTNGNVLTSNGTTWTSTAPAGGGSWVYLSTVTASGSSTADIENTFNSTYDAYVIVGSGIYNTDNGGFYARLKVAGSYVTSTVYTYIVDESNSSSSTPSYTAVSGNTLFKVGSLSGAGSTRPVQVYIYINTPSVSAYPSVFWEGTTYNGAGYAQRMCGSAYCGSLGAVTGVRLYPQIGTFTGSFRLYGIKNS